MDMLIDNDIKSHKNSMDWETLIKRLMLIDLSPMFVAFLIKSILENSKVMKCDSIILSCFSKGFRKKKEKGSPKKMFTTKIP